ncbi:MAG: guanitoxin biosynthesis MBL fold metallo-hydrolase GntH [Gammaproteobacteria bacterium]|nr:guanitoxin biosynthesis MBL fold metallo-hydrolase GntH [Gammaproteobacteria bacterium]
MKFLIRLGMMTLIGALLGGTAHAQGAPVSPVKALSERDVYYPGTEDLAPDEMRVIALGTGQPTVRPKQAAASFLVELGNGDKFLFDLGYGSMQRLAAMKIPMDYLDKVFIGHLHMDHMGDLDALWIGGLKMNRTYPLRVWGPSGATPEMGMKHAVEGLKQFLHWDAVTVAGLIDTRGQQLEVNEFDYRGVNEIIYQENGVTIRSIPAIHVTDGAVSFILEWNGLKFAYSSDTFPNKWWMEHTKGADISIHECFASPQILLEKQKYPPPLALALSVFKHTSPQQFGKVMAMTEPRLAVGYHFYNDHDTLPVILEQVRRTYDGPLAMASDYMVFNVTKDDIRVRMAAVDTEIWPSLSTRPTKRNPPKGSLFSDFTESGMEPMPALIKGIYDAFNERNGTNVPVPAPK